MGDPAESQYPKAEHVANSSEYAMGQKNLQKASSRSLESYLDPEDLLDPAETIKYATSRDRVLMNYPFFGELLKKEGGHYRLKKNIPKNRATDIEEVESEYGPGEYQLRLTLHDSEEVLKFSIEEPEKQTSNTVKNPSEANTGYSKAELHLMEEELTRARIKIANLEERIQDRDTELDEYQRKVRKLNDEIIDTERRGEKRWQDKIEKLEAEIRGLEEKNKELDRDNFELKMDLKYADAEGDFDIMSVLKEGIQNPAIQELIQNFMKARGGANIHRLNPPQDLSDSDQQPRENPNQDEAMNQAAAKQDIMQKFVNAVFQRAAQALMEQNPDYSQVATFVQQNVARMNDQGFDIPAQNWINIAKSLVQFGIENNVATEKLADVVQPMLEPLDMAKGVLKSSPINVVFPMLKSGFDLNLTDQEEQVLKDVLQIFKARLSAN